MPSNKDYIKQAEELAEKLGTEVVTDGLNNEKLANLVSDLKAKVRDAELNTQADQDPPEVLHGSNNFENSYQIGDDDVPLGDLVGAAYEKSGLTVDEWNGLPDEDRDARIGEELAGRFNQAEHAAAAEEGERAAEDLPPYFVKKGKAIVTRRGILSDGAAITARDLSGGQAALDHFVKSGHVGKA